MDDLFAKKVSLGFMWRADSEKATRLHLFEERQEALDLFPREIPSFVALTLHTFENITVSDLDAKIIIDYGRSVAGMRMTDIRTIENYGLASRYLFERLRKWGDALFRLDLDLLKRLHAILAHDEVEKPGELRCVPVCIKGSCYSPPPYSQLQGIMEQGLEFLNSADLSVPERAFATFLFVSRTQPFKDANKRTAALGMNAVLLAHGYPAVAVGGSPSEFLRFMADFYETALADTVMDELFDMAIQQHSFYKEGV